MDRAIRVAARGALLVAFLPGALEARFGFGQLRLQVFELLVDRFELVGSRGGEIGAELLDLLLRLAVDFFQPQAGRWVSEIAGMAVSVPSAGHG